VPVATRREELAEAATDYALEHGLIGLSLRPLAHALGTSDRMLLYHFGDKDDLVATILRTTVARSAQGIRELPASRDLRSAVLELWRAVTTGPQERCQRLYVEAAALGLFGREPYATTVRETNAEWVAAVSSHFERAGLHKAAARQAQVRQRKLDATIGKSPQPAAPTPETAPGQQTTPDAGNANPNKPPKSTPKRSAVAG